jgi:hypothetical protein
MTKQLGDKAAKSMRSLQQIARGGKCPRSPGIVNEIAFVLCAARSQSILVTSTHRSWVSAMNSIVTLTSTSQ